MDQASYRTVAARAEGEYEEKKSRFLGVVAPVQTETEAVAFLDAVRAAHPMARHTAYAYVLRAGNRVRYSDDGEPQKTAGLPILSVMQHAGLTDAICTVTRYFGGTLLGTGGLVRAYTTAAQRILAAAQVVTFAACRDVQVVVEYPDFEPLQHWLAAQGHAVVSTDYADVVTLLVRTRAQETDAVVAAIEDFCQGRALVQAGDAAFQPLPVADGE